jgi:hypothetical protein
MPWPSEDDAPGFRNAFREIPAEELAHAASVVNAYGHWYWRGANPDKVGGAWKFSHYCDQDLRERLEVRGDMPSGSGVAIRIIEGVLRMSLNTPDSWTWEEIGTATAGNLECARYIAARVLTPSESQRRNRAAWDKTHESFEQAAKLARFLLTWNDRRAVQWLNVGEQFKCMSSELTRRTDERRARAKAQAEAKREAECALCCAL